MTFGEQAKYDVAAFLDQFGEAAIFNGTESITVIFDCPSEPVLDMETGGIMIAGPKALVRTNDVTNAKGKTLKIDGVTYKIIEARPDGAGMTTLQLSRD
ncbi:MAG: hypothetical protein IT393_07290 [Nitrospirae bacterium]|nr:hypothetical protein [Nitrospirota bacterium]